MSFWLVSPRMARAAVPSDLSTRAAGLLVERAVGRLPVRMALPDGRVLGGGGPGSPELEVARPEALYRRIGRDPGGGAAEAYLAGDWRAAPGTDLADLLVPFAERVAVLVPPWLSRLRVLVDRRPPAGQENTPARSRRNIAAHYDLGNDFFAAFLDATMSYSAAYFDGSQPLATDTRLEAAQLRKIDAMLDLAGVRSGHGSAVASGTGSGTRLLEVGTGWGALAIRAARRGARVRTITLSREQAKLARERVRAAGLCELVEVLEVDYREVAGSYDAIVSVEMVEAVGEAYWPAYFATLDRLLAPGGRVALQAITMPHERMLATRHSYGWIQRHVFPGGLIPSLAAIEATLATHTRLRVVERRELRPHYARTLRLWRESFVAAWPGLRDRGYPEELGPRWEFYLAYCEAGFRGGHLGVSQLQLAREGE